MIQKEKEQEQYKLINMLKNLNSNPLYKNFLVLILEK